MNENKGWRRTGCPLLKFLLLRPLDSTQAPDIEFRLGDASPSVRHPLMNFDPPFAIDGGYEQFAYRQISRSFLERPLGKGCRMDDDHRFHVPRFPAEFGVQSWDRGADMQPGIDR